jgi:hypothetical protein
MIPEFAKRNYASGMKRGLERLMQEARRFVVKPSEPPKAAVRRRGGLNALLATRRARRYGREVLVVHDRDEPTGTRRCEHQIEKAGAEGD